MAKSKEKPLKITREEREQRGLFKKKRAGAELSKDEVKAIKAGRKKLRKEMKARGIKSRREFELTAGTLGLYFDRKGGALLPWLFSHWLGSLIGFLAALLFVLFIFSTVQYMRGKYTINLSEEMFKEGFTLSDSIEFISPTTQLFANPAEEVPCISISHIPLDVDEIDGEHNDTYFAYTYYIRNEGENTVDYKWSLDLTADSLNTSEALWVLLFEDGDLRIYAKENHTTGKKEALPEFGDNTRGYGNLELVELAPDSDQFEVIAQQGRRTFYRVIPDAFLSEAKVAEGEKKAVEPQEIHKYTVVLYLEGDDPDATDELIGGHAGVEMRFRLDSENERIEEDGFLKSFIERIFDGLKFK
ncbi:MAG: hypothetical protein J6B94_08000 [Lachnospiraceae bacterium]|nr:hypothetical protein [Lachnospiraceae bacterium]